MTLVKKLRWELVKTCNSPSTEYGKLRVEFRPGVSSWATIRQSLKTHYKFNDLQLNANLR
jgi:predicted lipoprotein